MRRTFLVMASAAWLGALGCGGDGMTAPPPGGDGQSLARQFEVLADSVAGAGDSTTSNVLGHAAEIVRLTGHATPVTITIDGDARSFLAVAEQLDFPNLQCSWPGDSGVAPPGDTIVVLPPDNPDSSVIDSAIGLGVMGDSAGGSGGSGDCTAVGTTSMRTFIAWEPERMAEVVRLVADVGSNAVGSSVPDVMNELPTTPEPGDTAGGGGGIGPPGSPGFFGEYLVRDIGSWYSVEGSQSNDLEHSGGACTADRATFDWAEFHCESARFRFELDMRVEPLRYETLALSAPGSGPPPNLAEGSHTIALGSSAVDGVRLTVAAWTPPPGPPLPLPPLPLPPPGPGPEPMPPVDSVTAGR
jgi:hypothetical protein